MKIDIDCGSSSSKASAMSASAPYALPASVAMSSSNTRLQGCAEAHTHRFVEKTEGS